MHIRDTLATNVTCCFWLPYNMKFLDCCHEFDYVLSAVSTSHVTRRLPGTDDMDCSVMESTVGRVYQFRISYMHT
jgi:hypothetical protein